MSADLKSVEEDKNRVFAKLTDEMKAKEDLQGRQKDGFPWTKENVPFFKSVALNANCLFYLHQKQSSSKLMIWKMTKEE